MKIAVSYLKSDDYKACIAKIGHTSADYIHADLCDGKFVENKNFTTFKLVELFSYSPKLLDIHLMVRDPLKYVDTLASFNVETITFHLDATSKPLETIDYILSLGIKVGIALSPKDDVIILNPYLDKIDQVIILSVIPGKGGQAFMPEVLWKIDKLNEIKRMHHFTVEVDGGVNDQTIEYLKDKNIDSVVCGSFITDSDNYEERINILKKKYVSL